MFVRAIRVVWDRVQKIVKNGGGNGVGLFDFVFGCTSDCFQDLVEGAVGCGGMAIRAPAPMKSSDRRHVVADALRGLQLLGDPEPHGEQAEDVPGYGTRVDSSETAKLFKGFLLRIECFAGAGGPRLRLEGFHFLPQTGDEAYDGAQVIKEVKI